VAVQGQVRCRPGRGCRGQNQRGSFRNRGQARLAVRPESFRPGRAARGGKFPGRARRAGGPVPPEPGRNRDRNQGPVRDRKFRRAGGPVPPEPAGPAGRFWFRVGGPVVVAVQPETGGREGGSKFPAGRFHGARFAAARDPIQQRPGRAVGLAAR